MLRSSTQENRPFCAPFHTASTRDQKFWRRSQRHLLGITNLRILTKAQSGELDLGQQQAAEINDCLSQKLNHNAINTLSIISGTERQHTFLMVSRALYSTFSVTSLASSLFFSYFESVSLPKSKGTQQHSVEMLPRSRPDHLGSD